MSVVDCGVGCGIAAFHGMTCMGGLVLSCCMPRPVDTALKPV